MIFVLKNFLRNGMALDYYTGCLERGINDIKEATHPNLYELGKEMYDSQKRAEARNPSIVPVEIPKRKSERTLEEKADFCSLVRSIKKDVPIYGKLDIKIGSRIVDQRSGISFYREYTLAGKTFRDELCHYDTRQEFESEEPQRAVDNLKRAIPKFSFEIYNNIAVVREAARKTG